MTGRRRLCSLFAAALAAAPVAAFAQGAAADRAEASATVTAPRKPRPARRRTRQRGDQAAGAQQQQAAPDPAAPPAGPRLEAAPVPNRDLEPPRAPGVGADRAQLSPSVIHRPLPSQGMATEGAQSIQEERLFFPAPGARLKVPFAY